MIVLFVLMIVLNMRNLIVKFHRFKAKFLHEMLIQLIFYSVLAQFTNPIIPTAFATIIIFNINKSLTRNSLYAIHSSYYSISIALSIGTIIMIVRLVLHSHNVQFDILRDFPQNGIKYNILIVTLILILVNIKHYSIICFLFVIYFI